MQTFLPHPDFAASARVLDDRRLGKQRVETYQVLRALTFPSYAWKQHPAVRMWRGFVPGLVCYGLVCVQEWTSRGFADTTAASILTFTGGAHPEQAGLAARGQLPPWLGLAAFHTSHQSSLVRKDPAHYRRWFPDVPDDLPYLWPPDTFPRWPARRGRHAALEPEQAAHTLGLEQLRSWQADAVETVAGGRDVLVTAASGAGGTTAALAAALGTDGPTVWVTPAAGERAADVLAHELGDSGSPGPQSTAKEPAPLTARAPSQADAAATAAEVAAEPEVVFLRPEQLDAAPLAELHPGLVVVDDVQRLGEPSAAAVTRAVAELGSPPVLAVAEAADRRERETLTARLHLREPLHTGGGWDRPAVELVVDVPRSAADARTALGSEVRARTGPALVLTADRGAAERVAALLTRRGLRSLAVAPGMRTSRVAEAGAEWRRGRLAALVAPGSYDVLGLLGRRPVPLLVAADAPLDASTWHAQLSLAGRGGGPARAVLLAELPGLTDRPGCRWLALLDRWGEPVPVPCGRCDVCVPELARRGTA